MSILNLPEDCLSIILSLTTPRDIIRSSATSKRFLSASLSNIVWDKFIPSDIDSIVHRASPPIQLNQFASKKDLFQHLSQFPLLFDNSTKSFWLDKGNGKKCYMIAAEALWIAWSTIPELFPWVSLPESRFPECAVLTNNVSRLQITGNLSTLLLSQNTLYGVYFVFKIIDQSSAIKGIFVNLSVSKVSEDGLPQAFERTKLCYLLQPDFMENRAFLKVPVARNDGWMEVEMGMYRFGVNGDHERLALKMSLWDIENGNWKSGLVVDGIDLRPLR